MQTELAANRGRNGSAGAMPGWMRPAGAPSDQAPWFTRVFGRGERVFGEGDPAAFFYRVKSGVVRSVHLLRDGQRQIAAFHLPGEIFGIESGAAHRFRAEAIEGAALALHRRLDFGRPAPDDEPLHRQIMTAMIRSLERAEAHALLLGRKHAVDRVAAFLLDLAARLPGDGHSIELPMPRADIADHLGLTIETVSRSLTSLERSGVIALPAGRRSIALSDKAALARLGA